PVETELINDVKETPAPEEEKPAAETETATKWRLQLEDEVAYIAIFYSDYKSGDYVTTFYPGIVDEQLIAEFVEMLNNIRMIEISDEDFMSQYLDEFINNYNTYPEGFWLYNSEGKLLGDLMLYRACTDESYYPDSNPGWSRLVYRYAVDENGKPYKNDLVRFLIDEDTFDEELMERVWRACFCGLNPEQFFSDFDKNVNELDPINIKELDVVKQYSTEHPNGSASIIVVPVE
nr:hypothetical protein [Eubacteriales bacterium]